MSKSDVEYAEVGQSPYAPECRVARDSTECAAVAVLVVGGNRGTGCTMQMLHDCDPKLISDLLRSLADEVDKIIQIKKPS